MRVNAFVLILALQKSNIVLQTFKKGSYIFI